MKLPPAPPRPILEKLLKHARHYSLTKDEFFEQTVSFVYGQLPPDSPVTKDQIRETLKNPLPK